MTANTNQNEAIIFILEIYVDSGMLDDVSEELTKIPEVMSLYEVTGSADLVALIKCPSILLFRNLLVGNVMKIDGVRNIISSVVLSATKPQHLQS